MVSAKQLKKYFMYSHKIWNKKHQDKAKIKFESCDLDLIFKVTSVIVNVFCVYMYIDKEFMFFLTYCNFIFYWWYHEYYMRDRL